MRVVAVPRTKDSMNVNCKKCGIQFNVFPSRSKRPAQYCSALCWYSRNSTTKFSPTSTLVKQSCTQCQKSFSEPLNHGAASRKRGNTFCSRKCYHLFNRGSNHADWGGGVFLVKGYPCLHDSKNRIRPLHVLAAEKVLGRELRAGETVHHVDGNKKNYRNDNLLICTRAYHAALHHRMSYLYQQEHF